MFGCRCPDAAADRRLRQNQQRMGVRPPALVPAIGSSRRIEALAVMAWPKREIGAALGVSHQRIWQIQSRPSAKVSRATHDALSELYRVRAFIMGPSEETRRRALKAGLSGPLDWDDIDDPDERPTKGWIDRRDFRDQLPDENVAEALISRRVKWSEVRLLDRHLAAHMILQRMSSFEAGRQLNLDPETIGKAARKYRKELPPAA